jgi:3-oxoacyl-[acyl-carrier-protein] synthase II
MQGRVFVTGLGIISAIGKNIPETLDSLLKSRTGIGKINHLQTNYRDEIPVAEVPFSYEDLLKIAGIQPVEGYTRSALLGMIAAREALASAKIINVPEYTTGLISATTVGGMDRSETHYLDFLSKNEPNVYIDTHDCADSTEKIADYLGIRDFLTTISTACSSSTNAIILGARMIKSGRLKRVVAGGTECLSKYHLNGFNAMSILDRNPCRPFDETRNGITLGEGAAYLVLESEETALDTPGKKILCEITGYGNACEAFHQTATSPEGFGPYLAMKLAFDSSNIKPEDITYINAHGTGTENNDLTEGMAIQRLFANGVPYISSTKSFTGHTTSAAGSVEAILSILAMQHSFILPNLNFSHPMKELSFTPVGKLIKNVKIKHILSNSFGFGGNDSSIIFSAH